MRIFLAGATGVVGMRLVPLLVAARHQVTGLARTTTAADRLRASGAEPAMVDVFDADALTAAVGTAAPDVVIHQLTALSGYDFAANARIREVGTRNLVAAARAAGTRRMIAQSIAWAYSPGGEPATEDTPLDVEAQDPARIATVSGVTALEDAVRELPEWVVLRYGLFYGPGTWYAPGADIATRAMAGGLVAGADVASFVHIDDAAAAALAALDWPTGAVNICDDEPAAAAEWVPAFCRWVGAPAPAPAATPRTAWARGADNHYARKHLGWVPVHPSWRAGFTN